MPLPADLTTIVVTGAFPAGGGAPLQGAVTFTPSADLTDSVGHAVIRAAPVEASLDYTGSISQVLVCTDNPDLSPSGWTWTVTERVVGLPARTYSVLLPRTLGPTIDLAELVRVTPVTPPAGALLSVNNLADIASASVSRTNLGLGPLAVLAESGVATQYLNGQGGWTTPAGGGGGVQIGGDLGGTSSAPTVTAAHLAAPLPLAQGGTAAADAPGARSSLGLGTAATQPTGAFDAAGAAAAALAAAAANAAATYVPLSAAGALNGVATLDGSGHLASAQAANLLTAANIGAAAAGPTIALASTDPTTTNARTPTAHAGTHASGGTDPVTPAAIGAVAAGAVGAASGVASLDVSGHLTAAQAALLLVATNDLSDVPDKTAARGNLGLGAAAQLSVGSTAGTVAAGDDGRIAGAAQKASNLSDLASAPTARTNLGLTGAATAALPLSIANGGTGSGTQNFVDLTTGQSIAGVKAFASSPTGPTPVGASDLVPKAYADSIAQGLSVKASARLATAAALPANTYSNGASGLGATLTGTSVGVLTVDGSAVALGDRILVQNEAAAAGNGLYQCTAAGAAAAAYVLTRTLDMDLAAQIPGAFAFTEAGTVNAGAGFVVADAGPYVVGTTAITWTQFSGAGEVTAGTGLTKAGSTISLSAPVPVNLGGTGQITAQSALNALTGTQTAGRYLRSDGANAALAAIAPGDVPTLNQSTTGTAAGLSATLAVGSGGTGQTGAAAAYNALSPMSTLGDLEYESGANTAARLPGNTGAAKAFLTQTGTGTISAAPVWAAIAAADVPTLNQNTTGTAANVTGTVAVANGGTGAAAAAGARTNLGLGTQAQQNFGTLTGALAEVLPPYACAVSGGSQLTAAVLILNLIRPGPILATNLGIWLTAAGVTSSGANGLALYTEAGVLIDQTGDMSAAFAGAGYVEAALGAQQQLAANISYYLAALSHFSGTAPKAASAVAGQAIPVVKGHYLSLTKSATAAFPPSFTPSALTTSTAAYYMAMT